jgi:hypothetical protein
VLPIGKARIVRPGKDVTIVSYSIGVGVALEAAQELMARRDQRRGHRPAHAAPARQGDGARKPQAHQPHGGGRGRLADLLDQLGDHRHRMTEGFDDLDAPVLRVTNVDVPLPYAANLEKLALIKARTWSRRPRRSPIAERGCGTATSSGSTGRSSSAARLRRAVRIDDAMGEVVRTIDRAGAGRDQARLVARALESRAMLLGQARPLRRPRFAARCGR